MFIKNDKNRRGGNKYYYLPKGNLIIDNQMSFPQDTTPKFILSLALSKKIESTEEDK
jgi:hypothetical protein